MKVPSLSELKRELHHLPESQLAEVCLALAKYKKDNKEYLSYLLLESHDRREYVKEVRADMAQAFSEIVVSANLYYIKKTLRKILRITNKYARYVNEPAVSCELLIYYCQLLKDSGIPFENSTQLVNLFDSQLLKIGKLISGLHEDLQADFQNELASLFH
jgi:hypothetical protein